VNYHSYFEKMKDGAGNGNGEEKGEDEIIMKRGFSV
jgi:hypothetical protein